MIKKENSKATFSLLLGSLFLFSAYFFILAPHRLVELSRGFSSWHVIELASFFFLVYYLNFSCLFFQSMAKWEKAISLFSVLALLPLIFLYAREGFWVSVILLSVLSMGNVLASWQKRDDAAETFLRTIILSNLLVGTFFLFAQQFLNIPALAVALATQYILGGAFLTGAGFGVFSFFPQIKKPRALWRIFEKLTALPWLIWIGLTLFYGETVSLMHLPAGILSATVLTLGLLPLNRFRLPEKGMLGNRVFFLFSVFWGMLLALFAYLLRRASFETTIVYDLVLFFSLAAKTALLFGVMFLHYTLHKLVTDSTAKKEETLPRTIFEKMANELLFTSSGLSSLTEWQAKKIHKLSMQLFKEREEARHSAMLNHLRKELDNQFDDPVAAQLAVNAAQKYYSAKLVAVSMYDIEKHELAVIASAGELKSNIPAGYRQNIDRGIMGRAARERKPQVVGDTTKDKDYIPFHKGDVLSEVEIPLVYQGQLKGMFTVGARKKNAFSAADIRTLEGIASELMTTWERSGYNRRLGIIIQSGTTLSASLKLKDAVEGIALIARDTLEARFVFVTLFDKDGSFTRTASCGYAPNLESTLTQDLMTNPLLKVALEAKEPFRIRDVRKYQHMPDITIDHSVLRGLILIPIRLHGVSIGAILGFGKQGGIFFSEKDEALAGLLSTQSSAAIESAWLIQEVRSTSDTSGVLKRLSLDILETDKIEEAARHIAKAARTLSKASLAGIVLFSLDRKIETALEITDAGVIFRDSVPLGFIEQTLTTGEFISHSSGEFSAQLYLPIQTSVRKYGVLCLEFEGDERQAARQLPTLETLSNQAAVVLERTLLLREARQKTEELKEAFSKLQKTYDETLLALMSALDARDRETEGHSERVGKAAYLMGQEIGLPKEELRALQLGSLLHDIGKIGVSDTILNKDGKLTEEEWEIMRKHPTVGKKIIEDIPFLNEALPVVFSHHERWNGSGYPGGLREESIPLAARIFAVADIFDALTSHRPYRDKISDAEALAYLKEQSGVLVDPQVVTVFERLLKAGKIRSVD